MTAKKPDLKECPAYLEIHNHKVERLNSEGAYYSCTVWPFKFIIKCREVGWAWTIEGLGTEKKGAVFHTNDIERDLEAVVRDANLAAGNLVRQLLAFAEYKDYDDR
jgi:hypothetical protein